MRTPEKVWNGMRLHVIDDEDRITKYQDMLADRLRRVGEIGEGIWGHRGGNGGDKMHWFQNDGFWWGYQRLEERPNPKHWNAFGLTKPVGGLASHSIACEINIPLSNGIWSVVGAFVEDDSGEVYVTHSGKIGGGKRGSAGVHLWQTLPTPNSGCMLNGTANPKTWWQYRRWTMLH